MRRPAAQTRHFILDAAYEQFYRKGFSRVSVDEIAAAAKITKRTLYYHFKSKDELLASVLELHHELALARVRKYEGRYAGNANYLIETLFSELAKWSTKPGWTGAGFTRLVMEPADLPGHPGRVVARRHKSAVEEWYTELFSKAQISLPRERARELALLAEGAGAMILIHGDRSYADTAARAAKRLIRKT